MASAAGRLAVLAVATSLPVWVAFGGNRRADQETAGLVIRATVTDIRWTVDDQFVSMVPYLTLGVRNEGTEPMFFLSAEPPGSWRRPPDLPDSSERGVYAAAPVVTDALLFDSEPPDKEVSKERAIQDSPGGASVDDSPRWSQLRQALDLSVPPGSKIKTLAPGEEWTLRIAVAFGFPVREQDARRRDPRTSAWKDIARLATVWCSVRCDFWPANLEIGTEDRMNGTFGRELRRRWRPYGLLQLDSVYTRPVLLDLSGAPKLGAPPE
jgi:hypothetical protein